MAHGTKPYGHATAQNIIYGVQDMGELAARLGSIDTFDRRGNIIFTDDFECGHLTKWIRTLAGPLSTITLRTLYARSGAFSARLYAGPVATNSAEINHFMPYPVLGKVGVEAWYCLPGLANAYLYHGFYLYDGVNITYYLIRYNPSTGNVDVYDNVPGWQTFAVGLNIMTPGGFFVFKLVQNLATGRYVRCILNENEYDLSAYTAFFNANPTLASLVVTISAYNITQALLVYADDVIVTQNEP